MAQGSQDSVGCEGHVDLEWMESREVGLMRHRVIPPTDLNGQPSQAPSPSVSQQPQFSFPDAAKGVVKELSGEALVILFRLSVMFLAVDEFCSLECHDWFLYFAHLLFVQTVIIVAN